MAKAPLPNKKDVALALLEHSTLFIHLDPRLEEVRVPSSFKKQAQLVLQVGLNMAVPIRDLEVDDEAVSCTLSFSRTPHFCFMPWSAVYALVGDDGKGMVWPDDVPAEVAAQAQGQQPAKPKRPALRAVPNPPEASGTADASEGAEASGEEPSDEEEVESEIAVEEKSRVDQGKPPAVLRAVSAAPEISEEDDSPDETSDPDDADVPGADADGSDADASAADADAEPQPAEDSAAGSSKKRELPSYLRVVK